MAKKEKIVQFILAPLERKQIEIKDSELNNNGWRYSLVVDHRNKLVYMEPCPTISSNFPSKLGIPEMKAEFEHYKTIGYHDMSIDEFRDFCEAYWNS